MMIDMPAPVRRHLLLVDASPYIFRAYFALPSSIRTPEGAPVNAAHGFASFLIKLLAEETPSHLAVAFDGSLTTSFRNDFYPAYKANREQPPEALVEQVEKCERIARALGARTASSTRFEADDLIGSWLAQIEPTIKASIVTSDKDLAQLVDERVDLYDFAKGSRWDIAAVREKFGVPPARLAHFLALAGDSVDNIPGVPGVGAKTAARLLCAFSSIEEILANLGDLQSLGLRGSAGLRRKLEQHADSARLSLRLATIATDAPMKASLESFAWDGPTDEWPSVCERFGFGSLLKRGLDLHLDG